MAEKEIIGALKMDFYQDAVKRKFHIGDRVYVPKLLIACGNEGTQAVIEQIWSYHVVVRFIDQGYTQSIAITDATKMDLISKARFDYDENDPTVTLSAILQDLKKVI